VIATLAGNTAELESTGRIARVDGALWREIIVPGDGAGWVSARFLTETAPPAPVISYGTEPRANWDVSGLAAGDSLNVRTGPGVGNQVIATLAGNTAELESTGRIARVDGALWREIIVPGDGAGWVSARFLTETAPPA
jgi:chorismate-pyruvate lyase